MAKAKKEEAVEAVEEVKASEAVKTVKAANTAKAVKASKTEQKAAKTEQKVAKTEQKTENAKEIMQSAKKPEGRKFTKAQLVGSKRFHDYRYALRAGLEDGKTYTVEQAAAVIERFKGKL